MYEYVILVSVCLVYSALHLEHFDNYSPFIAFYVIINTLFDQLMAHSLPEAAATCSSSQIWLILV